MRILILIIILSTPFIGVSSNENNTVNNTYSVPAGNSEVQKDTVSLAELYGIFTLMFRYWDDGTRVRIVLLNETFRLHKEFLWEFLGLSPTRYRELIQSRVSSGKNDRPLIVSNELQMVNALSKTEGGVGYLRNGTFLIPGENNVKIFKISAN